MKKIKKPPNPRLKELEKELSKIQKAEKYLLKEKKRLIKDKSKVKIKIKKEKEIILLRNKISRIKKSKK